MKGRVRTVSRKVVSAADLSAIGASCVVNITATVSPMFPNQGRGRGMSRGKVRGWGMARKGCD